MIDHRHRHDLLATRESDPADAGRCPPREDAHFGDRETNTFAAIGRQHNVLFFGTGPNTDEFVAFIQLHGNFAVRHDIREVGQTVPADTAARRREHDEQIAPAFLVFRHRHDGRDSLIRFKRQQINQRLAPGLWISLRKAVDLHPVNDPARREEQHGRVGVADEDLADKILIPGRHPGTALTATPLGAIARKRNALDVTAMANRDDHVFALDQVFDIGIEFRILNRGAPGRPELFLNRLHFIARDLADAYRRPQNIEEVLDIDGEPVQFFGNLRLFQAGQALETQFEDRAGLCFRQPIAAFDHGVVRVVDQLNQRFNFCRGPVPRHQTLTGLDRILRSPYQRYHIVDIGDCNGQPHQYVGAIPCLVKIEFGPPADDVFAEIDKRFENAFEIEQFRLAVIEGQRVDTETRLQRRIAVELIEHHLTQ